MNRRVKYPSLYINMNKRKTKYSKGAWGLHYQFAYREQWEPWFPNAGLATLWNRSQQHRKAFSALRASCTIIFKHSWSSFGTNCAIFFVHCSLGGHPASITTRQCCSLQFFCLILFSVAVAARFLRDPFSDWTHAGTRVGSIVKSVTISRVLNTHESGIYRATRFAFGSIFVQSRKGWTMLTWGQVKCILTSSQIMLLTTAVYKIL